MANGHLALGDDVVELSLNVRARQSKGRTHHQWDKNNLYSLNGLVKEGYVQIFERDKFKVYDATHTKIWVTRGAVLQGYYCPDEGLWRIPLLNRGDKAQKTATF